MKSGFAAEIDDGLAILDGGRHRHGAGDMLASAKGRKGVLGVVRDRSVDVDGVNVRIGEDVCVVLIALLDAELVADLLERFGIALADRGHLGIGMALVDGNEFGTEAEADDGDAGFCDGRGHGLEKEFGYGP